MGLAHQLLKQKRKRKVNSLEYAKHVYSFINDDFFNRLIEKYQEKAPNLYFITRTVVSGFIITQKINAVSSIGSRIPDDIIYAVNDMIETSTVVLLDTQNKEDVKLVIEEIKSVIGDLSREASTGELTVDSLFEKICKIGDTMDV